MKQFFGNHVFIFVYYCEVCNITCIKCFAVCERYSADLAQLDNGIKVPPSGWKCEKCDLRENLWLNLTDGAILCGRRNFDGSGGNNHAVEHYQTTGYPLAAKLGTITPDSAGGIVLDAFVSVKIIVIMVSEGVKGAGFRNEPIRRLVYISTVITSTKEVM